MPQGIAAYSPGGAKQTSYVAVANAGDNTVTVLQVTPGGVVPVKTQPVTAPFDVTSCGDGTFIVTSLGSTVTRIQYDGAILNTFSVGPGAFAAACSYISPASGGAATVGRAVVSSSGDSSLYVIDLAAGSVIQKISGVPGSRSSGGVSIYQISATSTLAFVASTSTNAVTVVNLLQGKAVTSISFPQPVAMETLQSLPYVVGANGCSSVIFTNSLSLGGVPCGAGLGIPISAIVNAPYCTDTFYLSDGSVVEALGGQSGNFAVPGVSGAAEVAPFTLGSGCGLLATVPGSNSIAVIGVPPGPSDATITDAATFRSLSPAGARPLPPSAVGGALATVFTPVQSGTPGMTAATLPLPTTLGGVSVNVGGTATFVNNAWAYSSTGAVPAPLLYVSPSQINFQIPFEVQGQFVPVQIVYASGTTLLTSVRAGGANPSIFTQTAALNSPAIVLNQDNSVNSPSNPAKKGSVVQIFANGAGPTTPALADGQPAPANGNPLIRTQAQPTVVISGVPATVSFSGMAPGFVGLWQINAAVPTGLIGAGALQMNILVGQQESNTATINVQ